MLERKTFKFEFIQRNIQYIFTFSANVDKFLAEDLNTKLLELLYKWDYECEAYLMLIHGFVEKFKEEYQIEDLQTGAKAIFLNNTDLDWNEEKVVLREILEEPTVNEIWKLNKDIGEYDYYFCIKSIGYWYNFYGDCAREQFLIITKREKIGNRYHFKSLTQLSELDFEDNNFYTHFFFADFSITTNLVDLKIEFCLNEEILQENIKNEMYGKTVIPVEFPKIQHIETFKEYLEILKDIDKIKTLGDIKKSINTKQKIFFLGK